MKKSRYTDTQIFEILKESEAGAKTSEICRKYGMSTATFYKWKAKYGGLEMSDLKRMKALEAENSELKGLVADQALDIRALKAINAKKI